MLKLYTGNAVKTFMDACDQKEFGYFTDQYNLYCKLITEEYNETIEADNVVEIIDGIIDSIWVTEGLKLTISKFQSDFFYNTTWDNFLFIIHEYVDIVRKNKIVRDKYKSISQIFEAKIVTIEELDEYILSLIDYGLKFVDIKTLQQCWDEVERSNMSKISENGKVLKNEYGKVVKPESFSKADIKSIISKSYNI